VNAREGESTSHAGRAVAGSFASSGWTQAMLVVSGVLVARMLGPEERGELALLALIAAAFGLAGTLGLPLAVTYEIAHHGRDPRSVLTTISRTACAQAAAFTTAHALVIAVFVRAFEGASVHAALATLAWTPAFIALQFGLAALQGRLRLGAFNFLRALPPTLYAIAAVGIWFAGPRSIEAAAVAYAASYGLAAAGTLRLALRGTRRTSDAPPPDLQSMRRFGRRSLLGWFVPLEALRLDQAAVGFLVSPAALGLYVVAVAFTNLPRFVGQSLGVVAYPRVAGRTDPRHARREVQRFVLLAAAILCALVLALELVVGWLLPWLFGADFEGAVPLARVSLPTRAALALRRTLTDAARGAGRPRAGTLTELVGWLTFALGIVVLVPRFEVMGVAIAMLAASVGSLVACIWVWAGSGAASDREPVEAVG